MITGRGSRGDLGSSLLPGPGKRPAAAIERSCRLPLGRRRYRSDVGGLPFATITSLVWDRREFDSVQFVEYDPISNGGQVPIDLTRGGICLDEHPGSVLADCDCSL